MRDEEPEVFKRCTHCGTAWPTRDAFVADPDTELVGYQAFVEEGAPGLFLFNHLSCSTTLAIKLEQFRDLHDGPAGVIGRVDTDEDIDYCLSSRAGECPETCECALVRDVLGLLAPDS